MTVRKELQFAWDRLYYALFENVVDNETVSKFCLFRGHYREMSFKQKINCTRQPDFSKSVERECRLK